MTTSGLIDIMGTRKDIKKRFLNMESTRKITKESLIKKIGENLGWRWGPLQNFTTKF